MLYKGFLCVTNLISFQLIFKKSDYRSKWTSQKSMVKVASVTTVVSNSAIDVYDIFGKTRIPICTQVVPCNSIYSDDGMISSQSFMFNIVFCTYFSHLLRFACNTVT